MIKLIDENEYGAYVKVRPEFLVNFTLKESNPNFEVYDSKDGRNRFIVVKCFRMPDDEDIAAGRYGINFHRTKPKYEEAVRYRQEFPKSIWSQQVINVFAFSAADESEYQSKSAVWDKFYSYVWGEGPQVIWVTPHSGATTRKPDFYLPYPQLETDNYVAGVAARCAADNRETVSKRTMVSVHSHNWHGAIFDVGGFGVTDIDKLTALAATIEDKYHHKVQHYADECLKDSYLRIIKWLTFIDTLRGTLNPQDLDQKSFLDKLIVGNICKGLKLYGVEITKYTLDEFKAAFDSLRGKKIKVISCNHIFPAELIGQILDLKGKISNGQLNKALQIECMKFYLCNNPGLMSEMILDIVKGLLKQ
jgi:hypothetical protein